MRSARGMRRPSSIDIYKYSLEEHESAGDQGQNKSQDHEHDHPLLVFSKEVKHRTFLKRSKGENNQYICMMAEIRRIFNKLP